MSEHTEVISPQDTPGGLSVRRVRLQVSTGPDTNIEVSSSSERLTIGSAPGNDLVLSDPTVSRFHAELERKPGGYRLRDLESTNGTRVDHVRVTDAFVVDGSTLAFGNTTVRFTWVAEQDVVPLHSEPHFGKLVGEGAVMRALFARLARLAVTDATVLIEGESGTGKELVAEALHQRSPRASGPFVVVDCGSIPPELVESELFGHEKGSFTGATHERRGAFEAAHGGTLFLDEIGELPLAVQPRLLRALERRQVKRVGADAFRPVDVRFVAATHRDLRAGVNRGEFREDLYFRLAVGMVSVPPLRAHLEDLSLLLRHLWEETFRSLGLPPRPYTPPGAETLRQLMSLPWRGNVRELRNFVERSVAMSGALDAAFVQGTPTPGSVPSLPSVRVDLSYKDAKEAWLDHFEETYLRQRLNSAGGNVSQMAREAEVDRAHVIKLLRKHAVR
ncbi:sigma 54-interacting transcriptional regulator [Myxococcus sp. CA051A]|uniref:sigma 54-interacting transcriptional regulator n=1 Tax=unclassified Myxococcus TaxID=2648731 RepID=UPI00157AA708|nr:MULTISPECIES: sigma 54-interacting transcriptional regulator [unclassified Myxococcus]NTX50158.1 sigma 54-interacting transcriptional regulator [Myxococcus sp. CA039A]NTX63565.1 sigma 54-interacting transcriptional regulator [Myxococcus sp. CA051A]